MSLFCCPSLTFHAIALLLIIDCLINSQGVPFDTDDAMFNPPQQQISEFSEYTDYAHGGQQQQQQQMHLQMQYIDGVPVNDTLVPQTPPAVVVSAVHLGLVVAVGVGVGGLESTLVPDCWFWLLVIGS